MFKKIVLCTFLGASLFAGNAGLNESSEFSSHDDNKLLTVPMEEEIEAFCKSDYNTYKDYVLSTLPDTCTFSCRQVISQIVPNIYAYNTREEYENFLKAKNNTKESETKWYTHMDFDLMYITPDGYHFSVRKPTIISPIGKAEKISDDKSLCVEQLLGHENKTTETEDKIKKNN